MYHAESLVIIFEAQFIETKHDKLTLADNI